MGALVRSDFRPAWWLPGAHLQTLWPALVRRRPRLALEGERVELPDGDFIDLSWSKRRRGPIVLVLHGLEGDLRSHYAASTMVALEQAGFRPVFMHLRGAGAEPNRLPRSYHSGASEDLRQILSHLERADRLPWAAVGFSLGGNLLLKYLGETARNARVAVAVAVSVPFELGECAKRLETGLSRLYQRHLLERLRRSYQRKFSQIPSPLRVHIDRLRTFRQYDDAVTAPLNGFASVDDYYTRCSSRQFLLRIETRTLILHAQDDPFMYPSVIPTAAELGPGVVLELAPQGGHVGFVAGRHPWRPDYWLERRITRFLTEASSGCGGPEPVTRQPRTGETAT